MPLDYQQNLGVTALDQQQELDRLQGYAVVPTASGLGTECEVTVNTGTLGTGNNALSVASGSVQFGGTSTSVSSQTVDIATGDADPRKDVVYIDGNGSAVVKEGTPAPVPSEAPGDRFQTWSPAPYPMHDIDGVVLAVVYVPANASSIGTGDLRDRRVPAEVVADVVANSADIGQLVSALDANGQDINNVGSFSAGQADVTNETFIRATRSSDTATVSSANWSNAFDSESKDLRGEFNSAQFSPDETGGYDITAFFDVRGNTSAGDKVAMRIRNITDGTTVIDSNEDAADSFPVTSLSPPTVDLDSAKTYEVQVRNTDSDYTVDADKTVGVIKRSLIG